MGWLSKLLGRYGAGAAVASAPPSTASAALDAFGAYDGAVQEALERALTRVYGEQLPFHWGANVVFAMGGPDPLDGVSIFWSEQGPHWHYVSFGLAPFGFELTFRLAATAADRGTEPDKFLGAIAYQAPTWPMAMLNMLGRRVHRTGRAFGHGHWWQGSEGVLRPYSAIEQLAFVRDPELGIVETPAGPLSFLQAVAISPATLEAMKQDEREGRGDATLDARRAVDPLLISDARTG